LCELVETHVCLTLHWKEIKVTAVQQWTHLAHRPSFLIPFSRKRDQGSWEKWLVPRLQQKKKMQDEARVSCVLTSKEMLTTKNSWQRQTHRFKKKNRERMRNRKPPLQQQPQASSTNECCYCIRLWATSILLSQDEKKVTVVLSHTIMSKFKQVSKNTLQHLEKV
jgi:hypothetical protein